MSYQVNWKLVVYDLGLTEGEVKQVEAAKVQVALHTAVIKELLFLFPDLQNKMQIGLGPAEVVFLRN
jgi:hypothetical protein